jgi:hypothetical protein
MDNIPGFTLIWKFTDAGEPGTEDYTDVTIIAPDSTTYHFYSNLHFGNQQAHNRKCSIAKPKPSPILTPVTQPSGVGGFFLNIFNFLLGR